MNLSIPLSQLVAGRTNPRRVKPQRDAHRRLVASIRAHGLLEPLLVRPLEDDRYQVIAGNRRLAALRDVHDDNGAKVPCVVKKVDNDGAQAIGLAENFAREPMHPLDEAETFARLASVDCKGVAEIAAEFGVSRAYVRQRTRLASLAEIVKSAYRNGEIDTATAEAFSAVPADRQREVWDEIGSAPTDAHQVRSIIRNGWIDASLAKFDVSTLPPGSVSSDLFSEKVLIERSAFLQAQAAALVIEQDRLLEAGWKEVVVAKRDDASERMRGMSLADPVYDDETQAALDDIRRRRDDLEAKQDAAQDWDEFYDDIRALDDEEEQLILDSGAERYDEATRARGTVFLVVDDEGRVRTEYRVPGTASESNRQGSSEDSVSPGKEALPTSAELSAPQVSDVLAHEAIAVRYAVSQDALVRKRLLVLMLHERVHADALTVQRITNPTLQHAGKREGFRSEALDAQREWMSAMDPLEPKVHFSEEDAYRTIALLTEEQLDALIDALVVECLGGNILRATPLISLLRTELRVSVRQYWRPDAKWLAGYQKCQLAHLVGELCGPVHGSAAMSRKKSELVSELDTLFTNAAENRLSDEALAQRLNEWLPAVLRDDDALTSE